MVVVGISSSLIIQEGSERQRRGVTGRDLEMFENGKYCCSNSVIAFPHIPSSGKATNHVRNYICVAEENIRISVC